MKTLKECPNCHSKSSFDSPLKVYVCETCKTVYCSSCPSSDGGAHCPSCDSEGREQLTTLIGETDDMIIIKEPNSITALLREDSTKKFLLEDVNKNLSLEEGALMMVVRDSGLSYEDYQLVLKFTGTWHINRVQKGRDISGISKPDHKTWDEPCLLVKVRGNKQVLDLSLAAYRWGKDDPQGSQRMLRQFLTSPYLTQNIKADATALMGCTSSDSALKSLDESELKQSIAYFVEAFELGKSDGWALQGVTDDSIYADRFADCLFELISVLMPSNNYPEIDTLIQTEKDLISRYRERKGFRALHHEGLLFLNEGMRFGNTGMKPDQITAMNKYRLVVAPPLGDYFVQDGSSYVLGIAYRNMGLIHYANKDEKSAIQMFQAALKYLDPDSEDALQLRRAMGIR